MRIDDPVDLKADVQRALDAVLAVYLRLEGLPEVAVPPDALDVALCGDEGHSEARKALGRVMRELRAVLGPEHLHLFFTVEERANEVSAKATDVGFRLGTLVFDDRTTSKSKE